MKNSVIYAVLGSLAAIALASWVYVTGDGEGWWVFIIAAPLAVFPVAFLVWRWLTRDGRKPGAGGVILAGVISGSIPHYLTFLIAGLGMSVCHLVSNGCVDSLGNPPAGLVDMLLGAFGFTFFSLLMFGWISIPLAILAGFWVRTRE